MGFHDNYKKNDVINKRLINHAVAVALLSGFALSGLGLQALAADATLSGVLVVSRDITKPQLTSTLAPAQNISACKNTTTALKKVNLRPLPDEAAVSSYREALKAEGVLAIEPSLATLDRKSLETGITPLLGQPLNKDQIDKVRALVLATLSKEGSMLADIYFPPQRTEDGYLVVIVSPAKVGKVVATGQKFYDGDKLTCALRTQPGEQVNLQYLTEDLLWLNRTPWRVTDMSYAPGENPGEADITLATTDRKPFRPYVSLDNTGTRATGLGRYKVGVSYGNPFGFFDHRIDYSYTRSNLDGVLNSHGLSYSMPVFGRNTLTLSAARTDVDVLVSSGDARVKSANTSFSASLNRALPALRNAPNFVHEGTLGIDYKKLGSNVLFGGTQAFATQPEIMSLYMDYSAGLSDKYGKTNSYTRLVLSPGFGFGNNTNAEFDTVRTGAKNSYWYVKETIDRSVKLPKNWGLRGVINAQYAPDILLFSERMALTGANAVRGYYEDSLYADSGVMLNLELQAPPKTFKVGDKQAQLQAFGFYDIGRGFNNTADVNTDLNTRQKNNTVSSFGVGARFSLSPLVQLNGTLGVAQQGLNNRGDDVMGNISLVIGF